MPDRPCVSEPCTSATCAHRWMTEAERYLRICALADLLQEMVLRNELAHEVKEAHAP